MEISVRFWANFEISGNKLFWELFGELGRKTPVAQIRTVREEPE